MLKATVSAIEDNDGNQICGESFIIETDVDELNGAILWGFSRQQDADRAKDFLLTLKVNWYLPSKPLWDQLHDLGFADRDQLMRAAIQDLAW